MNKLSHNEEKKVEAVANVEENMNNISPKINSKKVVVISLKNKDFNAKTESNRHEHRFKNDLEEKSQNLEPKTEENKVTNENVKKGRKRKRTSKKLTDEYHYYY